MEQAELYLATVVPWPDDTDDFYVNIHWTQQGAGYAKPMWSGRATRSVKEASSAIAWALTLPDVKDIYVCMSGQTIAQEKVSKTGRKYMWPIRNQQGARKLKSFFVDLDAKGVDKNSYASIPDALAALAKFIIDTGLPRPTLIVISGNGLHVYWTVMYDLTPDQWKPLAYALAEATKRHGLKCDTQCTIDSARILRVPDTFNRKSDPPKPVKLGTAVGNVYAVEYLDTILTPYKVALPQQAAPVASPLPRLAPLQGISDLSVGVEMRAAAVNLDDVAKECAFINEAITSGGKDYANPLWNLTTLISVFTEGQEADAHRMARGHKDYTQESTQALYERKAREQADKNLGWPACTTISGSGSKHCQSCRHYPLGKSPLHTVGSAASGAAAPVGGAQGTLPPGSIPVPDDLPAGYSRDAAGLVSKGLIDDTGATVFKLISNYPLTEPWLSDDPSRLHFMTSTQRSKDKQISIDTGIINGMGMRAELQEQGFMLPPGNNGTNAIGTFLMAWVERLQRTRDSVTTAPFGWDIDNGKTIGFSFDSRLWTPAGDKQASNVDRVLAKRYAPTGDRSHWDDAANMVFDQGRPALEVILASAFAGPLMKFTGHHGVLLSAYSSESGIGKTSTLTAAAAVWGRPKTTVQMLNDTGNSVMNNLGKIKSLPLYWDEIKSEEQHKKFVDLTFQVTQGREKSRLTSRITQREMGVWETLLVSCSNDSILDYVVKNTSTSPASLYRVFEFEVPRVPPTAPGQISSTVAQLITAKLEENHSHVGLQYAQFLGPNHLQIEADLEAELGKLEIELNIEREERYWNVLIGALLVGARYANQLGITRFDEPAMKAFLAMELNHQRRERNARPLDMNQAMSVSTIFGQFLNAMRARHMLVTNKVHVSRGKPAKGAITLMCDVSKLDEIHVHVGKEDKILRISSIGLGNWLTDKGYTRHRFMAALEREFGFKKTDGIIGSGTEMAGTKQYLLEVDLAATSHINFIDEL